MEGEVRAMKTPTFGPSRSPAVSTGIATAAVLVSGGIGRLLDHAAGAPIPFAPALGVAVAVLLMRGWTRWPGIAIGLAVLRLLSETTLVQGAVTGAADIVAATLAAALALRLLPDGQLARPRDIALLGGTAILIPTLLPAAAAFALHTARDAVTAWCGGAVALFAALPAAFAWRGVISTSASTVRADEPAQPVPEDRPGTVAQESRIFLHTLIDAIPSPVLVKDTAHRYVAVNEAFERFFKRPPELILGRTDHDFFDAKNASFFIATDDRALSGETDVHYEHPYRIQDETTWMMVQKTRMTAPDGSHFVLLLMIDVTARRAAEEKVRANEERFRGLTAMSADWYWEQDADLRFTYLSPTAEGRAAVEPGELLGATRFDGQFEWESPEAEQEHRQLTAAHKPFRDLVVRGRETGRWGLSSGDPVFDDAGRFSGYRGVGRDITDLKRVEEQLRRSEARFRDFAEAAGEFVWETDTEQRYTFLSPKVRNVLEYADAELIGRRASELMPEGEAERVAQWLEENTEPDGAFRDLEHKLLTRSGATVWITVNAVGVRDAAGQFVGHRGTVRDVTDRKHAEERISHLATRDPLTGLPNRLLLHDRLEQALVNARRSRESVALMFLDLDRFKNINDSLGHHVGDLLLKEVAARVQGCLRKGDTLSRLGGDEFVVTVEGLQHAEDAAQVARKILNSLAQPMDIAGNTLTTSCSVGISIFPADGDDSATLMKNADTAMYHAKEKGRRNYQFFSREMNIRAVERHDLETALRLALDRDEFVLHYQPQVDIASSRVIGVEALLRWQHPRKGLVAPSMFIDVAEETGLIEAIGLWALRAACDQNKRWQEAGLPPLRMAVNISARQFDQPREFAKSVHRILATTGLDPCWLELEMTESVLWKTADESIQVLRKLGKNGTHIAVDDFGTGYSSLAYLKQLPIHTLKIDRSFVRELGSNKESDVIVATIIGMAHSLNLSVTAEGVDNLAQLAMLKRLGCDEHQGFLFSKPLPPEEIARRYLAPRQLNFGG
jgi:diguanylate cyclase (GGDEF)-like protein/PAS domain S-box-containing protein